MTKLVSFICIILACLISCFKNNEVESNLYNKEKVKADSIPKEYRECLNERASEDSLLIPFFKNINENWNNHSTSFGNPGCLNSVSINDSNAKQIVEVLISEISNKNRGNGYRTALLFDLRSISCHNVRPPYYKEGLVVFEVDSVQDYVIDGWNEWWKKTKHLSYYEWNLEALKQKNGSKYSTYTAISNLKNYGDKRIIPHFIEKIDTTIFHSHQNYNASLVAALVELNAKEVIPIIINYYLSASPKYIRTDGIKYLEKLAGETLDYKPLSSKKMRTAAIKRWWKYWDEVKSELKIVKSELN